MKNPLEHFLYFLYNERRKILNSVRGGEGMLINRLSYFSISSPIKRTKRVFIPFLVLFLCPGEEYR